MWRTLLLFAAPALLSGVLLGSPASAQATRTWVSGVGDDVNPCSRTAPCKTFAGAISKTVAGGEIDALDPGGFGALTITKAITIDGGGGQVASVLVAGTNGIVVSAGASDVVILRNLRLNGLNQGLSGVVYNSAAQLSIENCSIFGFTQNGINVNTSGASELYVTNTSMTNVANGINLSTTSSIFAAIDHTYILNPTTNGISAAGSGNGTITAIITNTLINSAATAITAGSNAVLDVDTSSITKNNTAFNVAASSGVIRISNNNVYDNQTNYVGAINSTGNNRSPQAGTTNPSGGIQLQ